MSQAGAAPRATVVVTCFNQEQWIEQALDSVAAQTERDLELIVTDDGSSDGSRARIEQWLARREVTGVLVASDRNVGLPAMLNRAMTHSNGRFVVVLNGDDWMEPDRIALQAGALEDACQKVGLVWSDIRIVDADGKPTGEIRRPTVEPERPLLLQMISSPMLGMSYVMFRRRVLDMIGPWDESLVADDYDFLLRMAASGFEFIYQPGVVTNYRSYGDSMTSRAAVLAEGRILALLKLFGRDTETDRAIVDRVADIAVALHSLSHDRRATRRHLRFVMRRQPSRRVTRALAENYLRLRPATLSTASLRRAFRL